MPYYECFKIFFYWIPKKIPPKQKTPTTVNKYIIFLNKKKFAVFFKKQFLTV